MLLDAALRLMCTSPTAAFDTSMKVSHVCSDARRFDAVPQHHEPLHVN